MRNCLLLVTLCLAACQVEGARPWVALGLGDKPIGVGGSLYWNFSWEATCEKQNLFDANTRYGCNAKETRTHVVCEGVPCTASPTEALGSDGLESSDEYAAVVVQPEAPGTLVTRFDMTRLDTDERVTESATIEVLAADRLTIECGYEVDGQYPWTDCPPDGSPYVPGSIYLFWVHAYAGQEELSTGAKLQFEGWVDPDPDSEALVKSIELGHVTATGPGRYSVRSELQGLTAEHVLILE
jgi:hypothetical protein